MKVILLQNIKGFGRIGDIKNVSDGYARNMLFPKKLAKVATGGAVKEAESLKTHRQTIAEMEIEIARKAAAELEGMNIEFNKKASPSGTLFSSLTKPEIAKELSKKSGMKIGVDMIETPEHAEHIKHIGSYPISVRLSHGLGARVEIIIKPGN